MALAFRSAGTVFNTGTTGVTTFTANVPTAGNAPQTNDILLAIAVDWAGSGVTWTTPGGWTLVRNDNDGVSGNIGVHVYRKIAGASEANQNFTLSVAEEGLMVMLVYSGGDTTTPVDASGGTAVDTITALQTPSVTTTVTNDILVLIYGIGSGGAGTPTMSTPAGSTQRLATTQLGASNNAAVLMICDIAQAASGASAQYTSTLSGIGSTYGTDASVVALKPAGAAAQDTPELRGRPFGLHGQQQMSQLLAQ